MVKKSALVAAVLTAGLLLGAPLASATEGHGTPPPKPPKGGGGDHSVVDNRGCDAGDGILNVSCNPIGVKIGNIL